MLALYCSWLPFYLCIPCQQAGTTPHLYILPAASWHDHAQLMYIPTDQLQLPDFVCYRYSTCRVQLRKTGRVSVNVALVFK